VNALLCSATQILGYLLSAYTAVLLVYAVASWFPGLRGRWLNVVAALVEPVLAPVRRVIPPIVGFDLAFLVVILVLQLLVRPLLANAVFNACSPY